MTTTTFFLAFAATMMAIPTAFIVAVLLALLAGWLLVSFQQWRGRKRWRGRVQAKQKRPGDGWAQESIKKNLNSAETTYFTEAVVTYAGPAEGLPDDPKERHRLLNDSAFVVKLEGEF
ncbi:hypothetical protein ACMHYJ_05330 [Castellaniella hirudinis]|uniref:hypothetical protein n=1 Tax=Castellaniella hirudinis TaxID=1144617 RepID=UPI0039C32102